MHFRSNKVGLIKPGKVAPKARLHPKADRASGGRKDQIMKRLLASAAITLTLITGANAKDDLIDYSDRSVTCDVDLIASELKEMADQNPFGPKVIYVKDAVELSRSKDELRCKITLVHSRGKQTGIFRFFNQDGHALVGFKQ